MKILHITTFTSGGAGIACMRIHKQLRANGVDSKVLAFDTNLHNDEDIFDYKQTLNSSYKKLSFRFNQSTQWHHINSLLKGKRTEYDFFSLPYIFNSIRHLKIVKEADIIHLHWIANFINYRELPLLDKKIVWTLHDMNPVTGGCHYSYDCRSFTNVCTDCPQLNGAANPDIVRQVYHLKKTCYQSLDICFVAPSRWMLRQINSSDISSAYKSIHIPYGLDTNVYKPYSKEESRQKLDLPPDKKIILYVADNLENRRKGLHLLNNIVDEATPDIMFCCLGKNEQNIPLGKIHNLGHFENEQQLAMVYSAADLFIIPSAEDNLPNTVLESMACGTPAIGFNSGGIPEMIDDQKNGYVVERNDVKAMQKAIEEFVKNEPLRIQFGINARNKILDTFNEKQQPANYINLYTSLKKLKILHINTFDSYGGASQVAYKLVHNTDADCKLLVKKKTSSSNKVIEFHRNILDDIFLTIDKIIWKLGIKKPIKGVFDISDELNFTYRKLCKLKEYREADIIHLHNIHGNYFDLSSLIKIASEKSIVWTLHDMWMMTGGEAHTFENDNYRKGIGKTPYRNIYPLQNPILDRRQHFLELKKKMYEQINNKITFVPVSYWLKNCLVSSYIYNSEMKVIVNYNGIDTSIFHNFRKRTWTQPRLLFFNIDSPFKGSRLFLNIVGRITHPYDLTIVGEPVKRNDIEFRYIQYIHNREYLNNLFNEVDLLVFPSLAESFPLTVLEAMACGVCVVASNTGGIPEILNSDYGYLFKNGDEEELLLKVNEALSNLEQSRMKAESAARYVNKFSLEKNCNRYLLLYKEIINRKEPESTAEPEDLILKHA